MQSNHDHGEGRKLPKGSLGAKALAFQVRGSSSAQLSNSASHPALIDLVRLLAREAAAEWLAGEGEQHAAQENSHD